MKTIHECVSSYVQNRISKTSKINYFSFDRINSIRTEYIPIYSHSPSIELSYSDILKLAIQRAQFHERLKNEEKHYNLDYNMLRSIGIEFGIPFKRLTTNEPDIVIDQLSFFSLMMALLGDGIDEEIKKDFIKKEQRLMLYRLRTSKLSITEIDSKFWPDVNLRNTLILSYYEDKSQKKNNNENIDKRSFCDCENRNDCDNGYFLLDFEIAFKYFKPAKLNLKDGFAVLTIDDVYKIVVINYGKKLHKKLNKNSKKSNLPLIESLWIDFSAALVKNKESLLTLSNIEEVSKRSFPPCMYRIYESLKKSKILTFKAHFELALFLKGCGLDYYAQTDFWKLSKDPNLVNLKSIFGIGGMGKDYCPHSCVTMITREYPKNIYQTQGCPFRYMAKSEMKLYLKKINNGPRVSDLEKIVSKVPDHPQVACRLFFDSIHKDFPFEKTAVSHPVEYFIQSENRIRSKIFYH